VAIALVQEAWALISRYILEMEKYDISNWRLGIYRLRSVMKNPNIFGLYTLLIFIIYLSLSKKVNYFIFVVFLSGIIFSVSRVVYTGLIFLCIVHLYRRKKTFVLVIIPMLILSLVIFIINVEFQKRTFKSNQTGQEISSYDDYRKTTRETAISIWKDRMLLGIGPGMFGGIISLNHNSKVYGEYGYSDDIMWHLRQTGNIDQFWFQLIAEMGLVGVIISFLFFVALIAMLLIVRIWASSYQIGKLFLGLLVITLTIILFTTYTGLKNTPLMFTYSAIFGMAIASEKKQYGYYKSIK
jgi:O-antigen ligase